MGLRSTTTWHGWGWECFMRWETDKKHMSSEMNFSSQHVFCFYCLRLGMDENQIWVETWCGLPELWLWEDLLLNPKISPRDSSVAWKDSEDVSTPQTKTLAWRPLVSPKKRSWHFISGDVFWFLQCLKVDGAIPKKLVRIRGHDKSIYGSG